MKFNFLIGLFAALLSVSIVYASNSNMKENKLTGLHFMKQIEQIEKTKGDPLFLFSNVHFSGMHSGNLFVYKGKIIINGKIKGNIYAYGVDIHIGEEAKIDGSVKTISSKVSYHQDSKITGTVEPMFNSLNIFRKQWNEALFFYYTDDIPTYILELIKIVLQMMICLLFLSFFKKHVMLEGMLLINQTRAVLYRGLVIYLMVSALILIFTLSLVGFPIAIFLFFICWILSQLGKTALSVVIGEWVINKLSDKSDIYIEFWIGILLLQLVNTILLIKLSVNILFLPIISFGMFVQIIINKLFNTSYVIFNEEYENELNPYYQVKLYKLITKNIRRK